MNKTRGYLAVIFYALITLVLLGFSITTYAEHKNRELALAEQLNVWISQSAAITAYAAENTRLKEEMKSIQQYAAELKQYADNLSGRVIYVPQYHEQVTVKEVEVAKPVYVNNEWREFESVASLTEWVKEHLAYIWIVGDKAADCDDYAERLQREAFKDGYLLSLQVIVGGMLNGKNVSNYMDLHMGNLAIVGNEIYFIEPQPEYFRVVFVCYRD